MCVNHGNSANIIQHLSITVYGKRFLADYVYASAVQYMNSLKARVLSEKGCGKQSQNFKFRHFFHKTDVKASVVILCLRTELHAASLILHIHDCGKKEAGKPMDFFFIQTDGYRTGPVSGQQL